jgi:PAS domain S-box-containing protein
MLIDMYLHLRSGKRQLLLSFLPTIAMTSSIGFSIMVSPMDLSYIIHFLLFGCLLLIVLIDYQYVLKGIEAPMVTRKKVPISVSVFENEPAIQRKSHLRAKNAHLIRQPPLPNTMESTLELKKISDALLQKMQVMLIDLENNNVRIKKLEHDLDERQKNLDLHEKKFADQAISYLESLEKIPFNEKTVVKTLPMKEKIYVNEPIQNHLVIDEKNEIVAVVQRGIFKEVSNSFVDFLGYDRIELLQKNFFVFIAPQGFENARKYYLNRLKGVISNSFKTVLLSKTHRELFVEITVTPTIYNGDSAEFLSVSKVGSDS